jgi:NAD(P)-dependent dehydrogenase (short-subunit alcohol dehydrogenase family)
VSGEPSRAVVVGPSPRDVFQVTEALGRSAVPVVEVIGDDDAAHRALATAVEVRSLVVLPPEDDRVEVFDLEYRRWRRTLDAGLTAAMSLCRAASSAFATGGGSIVLVTHDTDRPGVSVHTAAVSGAVQMLARALAVEVGARGIRVNAVAVEPGRLASAVPALRLLLSEAAAYVTGEVVRVRSG